MQPIRHFRTYMFSLMTTILAVSSHGSELRAEGAIISVTQNMEIRNDTAKLEVLDDSQGNLTFETLDSAPAPFRMIERQSLNSLKGIQWFQGILENKSQNEVRVYFQFDVASHIRMNLYPGQDGGMQQSFEAGWKTRFSSWTLTFLHPTFEVIVPPGRSKLVIQNEGPSFYLYVGSKNLVSQSSSMFELFLVLSATVVFSLGLFNFFLFIRTLDIAYLYYSMSCLVKSTLAFIMHNIILKYFLPDLIIMRHSVCVTLTVLTGFSWLIVSKKFLSLELFFNKKLLNAYVYFLGGGFLLAGILPWVDSNVQPDALMRIINPLSSISLILIGIYMCFKRHRPAYFFVPAAIIYLTGVCVVVLATYGPVTSSMQTYLAPWVTGAVEALLMSFGLGDKYMTAMKAANIAISQKNAELGRDLSFMFKSLNQGIFSINQYGKISGEYSDHLKIILGRDDLADQDAFTLLFSEGDVATDAVDQMKNAAAASIGQDQIAYELNSHLLPHEIFRQSINGTQILEVEWQPLLNKDLLCEKIMVVLRDASHLRKLQEEAEKTQRNLKIAGQIFAVSLPTYENFSKNVTDLIRQNLAQIDEFNVSMKLDVALMFRNIHTIKGTARTYGFLFIADVAHEVENYFTAIRNAKVTIPDPLKLRSDLQLLQGVHEEYDAVIASFMKVAPLHQQDDLITTLNTLHQESANEMEVMKKFFALAEAQRVKRFYPTLEEMLLPVLDHQSKLAVDLAKLPPKIVFDGHGIRLNAEMESLIRNIFVQILRNSIDHGIEKSDARERDGKDSMGTITVKIDASVTQKGLILEICDDGAGLNIAALAKKCANPLQSDEAIAEIIFQTGISTAEAITHISGRGVGMDIIKDLVIKQGGSISIVFTRPKLENGRRPFKIVIGFPPECIFQQSLPISA